MLLPPEITLAGRSNGVVTPACWYVWMYPRMRISMGGGRNDQLRELWACFPLSVPLIAAPTRDDICCRLSYIIESPSSEVTGSSTLPILVPFDAGSGLVCGIGPVSTRRRCVASFVGRPRHFPHLSSAPISSPSLLPSTASLATNSSVCLQLTTTTFALAPTEQERRLLLEP